MRYVAMKHRLADSISETVKKGSSLRCILQGGEGEGPVENYQT